MKGHPAKFSGTILDLLKERTSGLSGTLLDPFAGTGRVHELAHEDLVTIGVELEPEWAELHPRTIVGNALHLPFPDGTFDVVVTSPCYGNRMADHHNAKDGSKRNTYTHQLERPLHEDNSGKMQWGDEYRVFHRHAWKEVFRVSKPGTDFFLNISDHIRKGEQQLVTDFHLYNLLSHGWRFVDVWDVETPRQRQGANGNLRTRCEYVFHLRKSIDKW